MEEERRRRERRERRRRRREQLLKEQQQRQQQEQRREQRRQEEEEQRRRRQRRRQQQELGALRAEVAALRRRLEQGRPEADPVPDPDRHFCQESLPPPTGPGESGSASEARLGRLQSGVSFLSELTGIRMTEYSLTRAELPGGAEGDGPRILRKGRLAGHCRDVTFHLEFQLLETQDEENPLAAITDLSIILEPMEYSELSRFVARTEETRDLFRFFRSLHFFLEWCEYRKRTFQYFKEKHGTVVQLPGGPTGDSMGLQSPRVPGFELLVVWTVHIDEDGQVLPRLDLLTKVPEPALTLDSRKVVERAPRCFRTLLELLGMEAAIEGLVRLLAPEE